MRHDCLPPSTPVFGLLAAAVPLALQLADPAEVIRAAVIGAGAGAIPAVALHHHSSVSVTAVDLDAGAFFQLKAHSAAQGPGKPGGGEAGWGLVEQDVLVSGLAPMNNALHQRSI